MKKLIIPLLFSLLTGISGLYSQDGNCPEIKVGVDKAEMDDAFLQKIINDNPGQPEAEDFWLSKIQDMVYETLRRNNPSVTFTLAGSGESYEYVFKYTLALAEIAEEDYDFAESIIDEFSTFYYRMSSNLSSVNPCGPGMYTGPHVITKSRELKVVVEANVTDYFSIEKKLKKYEEEHPVPPRAPEMSIELDPEFVSPLKEERTLRVKAKVLNCEGKPVYSKILDQYVYFSPKESERGHLKLPLGFGGGSGSLMGGGPESNTLVVFTNAEGKAEPEFKLENGIEAENLTVSVKTCGLVSFFIKELESFKIKGLEVKVRPVRKEIYQEEQTDIIISLKKTDPDGGDEPVPGKKLSFKVSGIVNGEIKPGSNYITDSNGEVRLHYKAGNKDERITVSASFQPEDYPDKAEGKGTVLVKPPEYDATITITKTTRKQSLTENHDSKTDRDGCTTKIDDVRRIDENVNATIYIQCRLSHKADMPIYNQTWEYYEPINANLSDFTLTYDESHNMYGSFSGAGCANGGYETEVKKRYNVVEPHLNEPPVGMWIVAFDNQTGKAVKLMPGGFSVAYDLDIVSDLSSRQWGGTENEPTKESETKRSENHTYEVGPVEDPVPDPTFKPGLAGIYDYLKKEVGDSLVAAIPAIPIPPSSSENAPEINPDLLVSSGDGIRSFGGGGSDRVDIPKENGYEWEENTYRWQMARIKINK